MHYSTPVLRTHSQRIQRLINSIANFAAFEIDDEALANLREYALANSLYWALAEGHACEQSARRNAMDVSQTHASLFLVSPYQIQFANSLLLLQNASKNAGDMINRFQILFNRTRQAVITGELVEIITGATASEDM